MIERGDMVYFKNDENKTLHKALTDQFRFYGNDFVMLNEHDLIEVNILRKDDNDE